MINEYDKVLASFDNMIKRNMIKILRIPKYGKTQYDKLFGFFYHIALSKYDKKNNQWTDYATIFLDKK